MPEIAQRRSTDKHRWGPMSLVQRVRGITDISVSITGLVAFFMFFLYLFSIAQPGRPSSEGWVLAAQAVAALIVVITVIVKRDKFPLWMAYLGVLSELACFIYFVGFTKNHEQVVFRLQEFPLIALYLSWLFPAWITRITVYPTMIFTTIYAVFFGPAVGTEHSQSILNIAGLTFFTVLTLTVGTFVRRKFRQGTEIDALTGALNRNGLSLHGEPALARALRSSRPLTVALIDLDGFKKINDSQGHDAGDLVLKNFVKNLKETTRKTDIVCRLGGDEFVMLFVDSAIQDAENLLLRARSKNQHPWSFGLAQAGPDDNLSTVILRADRSMYENKRRRAERT